MKYRTELHCHTNAVSACGRISPADLVDFYIECGYTSIVLTDHFSKFTFRKSRFGDMTWAAWDEKVDYFMTSYHMAKEAAGSRLNVILGCEMRSNVSNCDIQIYGITEEWLRAHEGFLDYKLDLLSAEVRNAGMLLVQPHPFRNESYIIKPELLDGIESFNGNLGHNNRNEIARIWAEKFGLIQTAGTDTHGYIASKTCSGILTDGPVTSGTQLTDILRSGSYELIRYGMLPY